LIEDAAGAFPFSSSWNRGGSPMLRLAQIVVLVGYIVLIGWYLFALVSSIPTTLKWHAISDADIVQITEWIVMGVVISFLGWAMFRSR
jgi:hypothetical protein